MCVILQFCNVFSHNIRLHRSHQNFSITVLHHVVTDIVVGVVRQLVVITRRHVITAVVHNPALRRLTNPRNPADVKESLEQAKRVWKLMKRMH